MINQHSSEEQLACEVCLKEIPDTVHANAEADEYVSHYCGLECYQQWVQKQDADL